MIKNYLYEAEKKYGKKSIGYVDALQKTNFLLQISNRDHEAYKVLLDVYDISKELYGDQNKMIVATLNSMAVIKLKLRLFEDAMKLLEKAIKIADNINFTETEFYSDMKEKLKMCQTRLKVKAKGQESSWILKTAAVTLSVLAIGGIAFYFYKKKQ